MCTEGKFSITLFASGYLCIFFDVFAFLLVFSQCSNDGSVRYTNINTFSNSSGSYNTASLEVCYNGTYGSVCDKYISQETADIICQNRFNSPQGQG